MKKVLLIILTLLFFQLKVLAGVDGIPDGTYIGKADLFTKRKGRDGKIIEKRYKSPLAIVIANGHITGILLMWVTQSVIKVTQSISINQTNASTNFNNGNETTTFTYDQTRKTIKFNSINNVVLAEPIGGVEIEQIYKSIGKAKALKRHNDKQFIALKLYTENINKNCNSTHFINIGPDGYVIAQLSAEQGSTNKQTFFGKILDKGGNFKTIYSELHPIEDRILSIISTTEKIIVKGVSREFNPSLSGDTTKDNPFEIDFLRTGCN